MGREWQPGDVAMVTFNATSSGEHFGGSRNDSLTPGTFVAVAQPAMYGEKGVVWVSSGGGGAHSNRRDCIAEVRPLVVIDPEDGEQIERLARSFHDARPHALRWELCTTADRDMSIDALQAALREFANPTPPKPDEPTGWLAAVEDGDGRRWYRDGAPNESHPWRELRDDGIHARYVWREIAAVRILSEGVTP